MSADNITALTLIFVVIVRATSQAAPLVTGPLWIQMNSIYLKANVIKRSIFIRINFEIK